MKIQNIDRTWRHIPYEKKLSHSTSLHIYCFFEEGKKSNFKHCFRGRITLYFGLYLKRVVSKQQYSKKIIIVSEMSDCTTQIATNVHQLNIKITKVINIICVSKIR